MPTCSFCNQRVWFWEADLFGGPCSRCGEQAERERKREADEREALKQKEFEEASVLHRVAIGAVRGALLGAFGLFVVLLTLVARCSDPGSRFPFRTLDAGWCVVSILLAGGAALYGWWFSAWGTALLLLVGVGVLGGALYGAYQGLRGKRGVFVGESENAI